MVLYIPNIIELIGFGLAIDYSLLIIHRFRREIMNLDDIRVSDAIVKTMETAGRTVILSGSIVSIGLATLLLVPVPFVRSLGAAGLVVPSRLSYCRVNASVSSTFIPRPTRSHTKRFPANGKKNMMTGMFAKIAHFVIRRPISVLLFSLAMLAIATSSGYMASNNSKFVNSDTRRT